MNQCITSLVVAIISMNIFYFTCGLSFWPIQKAFPTQSGQCPSVVTDTCEYLSIPRALTMVRCSWEEPHLESTIRTWPSPLLQAEVIYSFSMGECESCHKGM